jgi:hypothetical protein
VCRALTVLCIAPDPARLAEVKRAAVSADWELTAGATDLAGALGQLGSEHPHVVVAIGVPADVVRAVRERAPYVRIVTDADAPEADVVVRRDDEIRAAVVGLPSPGGPLR